MPLATFNGDVKKTATKDNDDAAMTTTGCTARVFTCYVDPSLKTGAQKQSERKYRKFVALVASPDDDHKEPVEKHTTRYRKDWSSGFMKATFDFWEIDQECRS